MFPQFSVHFTEIIRRRDPSFNIYRPQTKLRKGNVFTSVFQEFCLRGGGCISACTGQTPLPLGRHSPGQTPPWADPPTATAADGMHPTRMHSCFYEVFTRGG